MKEVINMRLNTDTISKIFEENNIGKASKVCSIDIGFTNDIYVVNDNYILKVCVEEVNEVNFMKECFCYDIFKGKIPVPKIIVSDTSKSLIDKDYMIYEKIVGDNLYSKWHLLNDEERKSIIRQLADIVNCINTTEFKSFSSKFKISENINWHDLKYNSLIVKLNKMRLNNILDNQFIAYIQDFIESNHNALLEQKIGLTYSDLHFDNVLVSGNTVTALIDFEKTDVLSIDYALDTIKRLCEYPYLFACEEYEKFVEQKDYECIFEWFKEFSPNLFDFKSLETRLSLYSIEYDMNMLTKFPKVESLKRRLAKTIKYDY